jgi:hypothetical protein
MRSVLGLLLVVTAAVSCGGGEEEGPTADDYYTQLQRVSETAQIQERGLQNSMHTRLEEAQLPEDRLDVLLVYVDQSAALYQDAVDAIRELDPPGDLADAQDAYQEAWQNQVNLFANVRDGGFSDAGGLSEALDSPAFEDAEAETTARCDDLQAAVQRTGSRVDLVCDGRPAR